MAATAAALFAGTPAVTAALSATGAFIPSTIGLIGAGGSVAAGSGLLASAFTGFGVTDFLSGGFSLFSALKSVQAGGLQADALRSQAEFADLASKQELLKGRKEALDLEALTLDELEQFQAGIGPRGITGSGSARAAQQEAITQSNRQQEFATENALIRSAAETVRSKSLRLDADAAQATGVLGAGKTLVDFALRRKARG